MRCFERAGLPYEKSIAEAYSLRQQARAVGHGPDYSRRMSLFSAAGDAFSVCAESSHNDSRRKEYYGKAGECFQDADDLINAAQAYLHGEYYTRAALFFRRAGMFDEAVDVVLQFRDRIDQVVVERIIDASRIHYFHDNKIEYVALIIANTVEHVLNYLFIQKGLGVVRVYR